MGRTRGVARFRSGVITLLYAVPRAPPAPPTLPTLPRHPPHTLVRLPYDSRLYLSQLPYATQVPGKGLNQVRNRPCDGPRRRSSRLRRSAEKGFWVSNDTQGHNLSAVLRAALPLSPHASRRAVEFLPRERRTQTTVTRHDHCMGMLHAGVPKMRRS